MPLQFVVDTCAHTIVPTDRPGDVASWFSDDGFMRLSDWWLQASFPRKYSYGFRWLGVPIIQQPGDILMMQDLIFRIRPTLMIETGIAHGGSVLFHASMLTLIHSPIASRPDRPHVVAIDIDIRSHTRQALDHSTLRPLITLLESSSIEPSALSSVKQIVRADDVVMVVLDSNHSRDHVLKELRAFAPLVTPGSAIVAMDGIMPRFAALPGAQASWRVDNPAAAIQEFLNCPEGAPFTIDHSY
ncbi:MAG: hydroxylase, partial [Phototrophicales bacterium]